MTDRMPREITDIMDLMEIISLQEIRHFELRGIVTGPPSTEDSDPDIAMEYSEFVDESSVHCRFRFTVETSDARYLTDLASVFALEEPASIDRLVMKDFAERVGFMAAFPYIRESLTTTASRMGRRAPLIGLMRPGDLQIELSEGTPD